MSPSAKRDLSSLMRLFGYDTVSERMRRLYPTAMQLARDSGEPLGVVMSLLRQWPTWMNDITGMNHL